MLNLISNSFLCDYQLFGLHKRKWLHTSKGTSGSIKKTEKQILKQSLVKNCDASLACRLLSNNMPLRFYRDRFSILSKDKVSNGIFEARILRILSFASSNSHQIYLEYG